MEQRVVTTRRKCGFFCRLKNAAKAVFSNTLIGSIIFAALDIIFPPVDDMPVPLLPTGEDALTPADQLAIEKWFLGQFTPMLDKLTLRADKLFLDTTNKQQFAQELLQLNRDIARVKSYLVFTSSSGEAGFTDLAVSERNRFSQEFITQIEKEIDRALAKANVSGLLIAEASLEASSESALETLNFNWQGQTINTTYQCYAVQSSDQGDVKPLDPKDIDPDADNKDKGFLMKAALFGGGLFLLSFFFKRNKSKK